MDEEPSFEAVGQDSQEDVVISESVDLVKEILVETKKDVQNSSCSECIHFYYDPPNFFLAQAYPEFCCSKGHWDGIGSQEEADALSEPIDCIDFKSRR